MATSPTFPPVHVVDEHNDQKTCVCNGLHRQRSIFANGYQTKSKPSLSLLHCLSHPFILNLRAPHYYSTSCHCCSSGRPHAKQPTSPASNARGRFGQSGSIVPGHAGVTLNAILHCETKSKIPSSRSIFSHSFFPLRIRGIGFPPLAAERSWSKYMTPSSRQGEI